MSFDIGVAAYPSEQNFTNDCRVGLAMRRDPVHGIFDAEKFLAGAIEGADTGATGIDEGLVDVEEK